MAGSTTEIEAGGRVARYVRVTAVKLWPRQGDYVFALGELEALAGGVDVALEQPVSALDSIDSGRWHTRNLIDESTAGARCTGPPSPKTRRR